MKLRPAEEPGSGPNSDSAQDAGKDPSKGMLLPLP
jgi:hypothetical protein